MTYTAAIVLMAAVGAAFLTIVGVYSSRVAVASAAKYSSVIQESTHSTVSEVSMGYEMDVLLPGSRSKIFDKRY